MLLEDTLLGGRVLLQLPSLSLGIGMVGGDWGGVPLGGHSSARLIPEPSPQGFSRSRGENLEAGMKRGVLLLMLPLLVLVALD